MKHKYEYRIIATGEGQDHVVQRGVWHDPNAVSSPVIWTDAHPAPAPTLEAAKGYLSSIQRFDAVTTPGRVVFSTLD
jgi:hypothetical protein